MCDSKADRVVTVNASPVQYRHNEERHSISMDVWMCVHVGVYQCVISASQLSGT